MRRAAIAVVLLALAARTAAQGPAPSAVEGFDVASIKANKSADGSVFINILPGGRFMVRNATLRELLQAAYQFEFQLFQIVGGDGWLDAERFNIDARSEGAFTMAETSAKVQAMLADRFHVVLRRETRPMPIFALVASRNGRPRGSQLHQSAGDCVVAAIGRGAPAPADSEARPRCGIHFDAGKDNAVRMIGIGVTMQQLADRLQFYVQRVVANHTRLDRRFDFELEFTPDRRRAGALDPAAPPAADAGVSIATALQEQLGLRLNSDRGPVPVLVIEHAERPAEN